MKLYSLMLGGLIRWNLEPDAPVGFAAIAEPGVSLLNPLVPVKGASIPSCARLPDGRLHVLSDRLNLYSKEDLPGNTEEIFSSWLRVLRIAARQAALPTSARAYGSMEFDASNAKVEPPQHVMNGKLLGEFRVRTAIDQAAVATALALKSEASAPLHEELMLDALLACETRRSREAILYSAIALESLAGHELDKAYEAALKQEPPPSHLNIVNFQLARGKVARKDPIYALLTDADNFGRLLHEAPLYLLRRSLLQDDQSLYQRAKKLYSTRNKLGHGQPIPPQDENVLPVDEEGAFAAVTTAIAVFSWFGKSGYHPPDFRPVRTG
ncbi:hypothetical protein ACVNIS_11435 [Sphaerotilaceae bacterium SBD11-9]